MCEKFNTPSTIWVGGHNGLKLGVRSYWKVNRRNSLCRSYNGWGKCSTGLVTIAFAMSVCDQISVFGFMPSQVNGTWQYGWYQSYAYTKADAGHFYISEKAKLYALHCGGRLTVVS